MNKNNVLNLKLNCEKEEAIRYIKKIDYNRDYIRVSDDDHYDVCLELTWRQHSEPYVEYRYVANIENQELKGKIVEYKRINKNQGTSFRGWSKLILYLLAALLLIYGVPFLILFAISDRLFLSLGLGVIPMVALIVFIIIEGNHMPVHKENIIIALSPILGNKQ
ncbi:MAG: hypothetical protein KKH01_10220 [Firmicutes bacterium]|nr:hypothetical protein [Bacillota bacterium]